jgi:hypothetical protein
VKSDDTFFSWEGFEEKQVDRTNDWYWGVGLIAIFGSAGAFIVGNFLFGVFILISAITLVIFARKNNEPKLFKITDQGIQRGDVLHRYKTIKRFWVDAEEDEDGPSLIIYTSRVFDPIVSIPIPEEIEPEDIRGFLRNILEEDYMREPKFHKLLDKIGL